MVLQDFGGLQMILMDRALVPNIPPDVYFFKFMFSHTVTFKSLSFQMAKLLLLHLAKA